VLGKRLQLSGLAHAILIEILPHPHIGELGVPNIEYSVAITVEIAQSVETIGGLLAIGLESIHAEQLTTVVDGAVAVAIKYQKAIVALDPASSGFQTVAIEVERNPGIGGNGLDTVAIEVEGEGVAAWNEYLGIEKKII